MSHFKKEDAIRFRDQKNTELRVIELIGHGNQGDVYRALDVGQKQYVAMKHCYGNYASDRERFHKKVSILSQHSAPHPDLCWPSAVSFLAASKGFVYAMPLLEGYRPLSGVITGEDGLTDLQKAEILDKAAEVLQALHKGKFVYGDISEKNILYKIEANGTIRVKFIDCENITCPGFSLGLMGSGKFRAPELLLPDPDREDGGPQPPSIQSDCFAFSVLAFRVLLRRHPLDGELARSVRADNNDGFLEYYARKPRFIFDGTSNAPSPRVARKWKVLPKPMQIYFRAAFSQSALKNKNFRPGMEELRKCLSLSYSV